MRSTIYYFIILDDYYLIRSQTNRLGKENIAVRNVRVGK